MDLKGKTILVTGGCGLIGSTLIDQLIRDEGVSEIRVIDNLSRGTMLNLEWAQSHGQVLLTREDIRHYDRIRPWFEGVDVVFHQAAIRITACAEQWQECQDVLVHGSFNVARACVEAKVGRLVAASSASVYGMADEFPTSEQHHLYNNRTLYGAAKIANEAMYRAFHDMAGLSYVALRYFNVYGPRMDVFGKYTEVLIRWLDCLEGGERPKIFGDGKQTMDFVYSGDVGWANVLAAKSEASDEVFNIASGVETSLIQLLRTLQKVTGHEDVEPEFVPERKVNPVPRRLADVEKAKKILGFECRTGLEEGLRRLVAWRKEVIQRRQTEHYDPHYQTTSRP